jgi:hypothetical protein
MTGCVKCDGVEPLSAADQKQKQTRIGRRPNGKQGAGTSVWGRLVRGLLRLTTKTISKGELEEGGYKGEQKAFARGRVHDKAYLYITSECFLGFAGFWKDVEIKPVRSSSIHIASIYKRLGRPSNQSKFSQSQHAWRRRPSLPRPALRVPEIAEYY